MATPAPLGLVPDAPAPVPSAPVPVALAPAPLPVPPAASARTVASASGASTASNLFKDGIDLRLNWLTSIWTSRPRDKICDLLLEDLKRIYVEAPAFYKIDTFFESQKFGSGSKLVPKTGSTHFFVEGSFSFLESLSHITTIGSWLDLPRGLINRMESASASTDMWDLLNVFSALSQAVSDHKMKGLLWAILSVGILELHSGIRTTKVPISDWPAKLRNCVAHSQARIIGPVFVGYNYNPEKGSTDDEKMSGCNWQIQVEIDFLMNQLKRIFADIVAICDVARYYDKNWRSNIKLI
jgi:hypothetical protein